jgi:hypothetical protein
MTPLEKMLHDSGPVRNDGSDKFFGMENVRIPEIHIVLMQRLILRFSDDSSTVTLGEFPSIIPP